jgi:hypothetical protein
MSKATEIVNDAAAFVRSTATTLIALTLTVSGFIATLMALDIVPEEYKGELAAVSAGAVALGTALRQVIAWLDKNNPSFGRVDTALLPPEFDPAIEDDIPDDVLDPVLDEGLLPDEDADHLKDQG